MANDQLVVTARRLGGDLRDVKSQLRKSYSQSAQVTSTTLKQRLSSIAEMWLAALSQRQEITGVISANFLGDLNIHFQRLLIFAERATVRRRYDQEINAILKNYTSDLVVPLMQSGGRTQNPPGDIATHAIARAEVFEGFQPTAFVGHSFSPADLPVINCFIEILRTIGVSVKTGEKPKADSISQKVKKLIEAQHLFVGIFTRKDKLADKSAWTTSAWVIDEKAYALGRNRKLILLKEVDVESIGGIQGDYEYIEFSRDKLELAVLKLLQLFTISSNGLVE